MCVLPKQAGTKAHSTMGPPPGSGGGGAGGSPSRMDQSVQTTDLLPTGPSHPHGALGCTTLGTRSSLTRHVLSLDCCRYYRNIHMNAHSMAKGS